MNTDTPHYNAEWLATLRIGTGFLLLAAFISLWPEYERLFGTNGLADTRLFELQSQPLHLLGGDNTSSWWIWVLYPLLCLMLALGFLSRGVAFALLLIHYHIFTDTHTAFSYGADYIASSCLFYCLLFPTERFRSIDQRLFGLTAPVSTTLYLRILQVYLCLIYFFAGLTKLLGPTWRNGEALWKAVTQPGFESFFKPDLGFLAAYPFLWVVGGWVVILLELSYPLFIWFRRTRPLWCWAMIGLHLAIALLMGLYYFSALMILLNLAAFHIPYRPPTHRKTSTAIFPQPLHQANYGSETPAEVAHVEHKAPNDV